jgi:hypothetical protein
MTPNFDAQVEKGNVKLGVRIFRLSDLLARLPLTSESVLLLLGPSPLAAHYEQSSHFRDSRRENALCHSQKG